MIDVKQKIHIDLVALYDLAYQNDLPKHVLSALSRAEHLIWELRRRDDKERHEPFASNVVNVLRGANIEVEDVSTDSGSVFLTLSEPQDEEKEIAN
jgi:hypothetical protein